MTDRYHLLTSEPLHGQQKDSFMASCLPKLPRGSYLNNSGLNHALDIIFLHLQPKYQPLL